MPVTLPRHLTCFRVYRAWYSAREHPPDYLPTAIFALNPNSFVLPNNTLYLNVSRPVKSFFARQYTPAPGIVRPSQCPYPLFGLIVLRLACRTLKVPCAGCLVTKILGTYGSHFLLKLRWYLARIPPLSQQQPCKFLHRRFLGLLHSLRTTTCSLPSKSVIYQDACPYFLIITTFYIFAIWLNNLASVDAIT